MAIHTQYRDLDYNSRIKLEVVKILEKAHVRAMYEKLRDSKQLVGVKWIPKEVTLTPEELQ